MKSHTGGGAAREQRWIRSPFSTFWCRKTLLRTYLTLPVKSATSERTFSALRLLKNYLRSTMKQDHLNNCPLVHCHKLITDKLDTVKIAKRFACTNEQRKGHFGKTFVVVCAWLSGR